MVNCRTLYLSPALALLLLADFLTPATASAQTQVTGKATVSVANAVPGVEFQGENRTNREICDFVLTIGAGCGVTLSVLTVTSDQSGGADDWDVDDNLSGMSQEQTETDDTDSTPDLVTRLDSKGTGDDGGSQNDDGKCIKKNQEFEIEITFGGLTTGTCDLCIAPTNEKGFQLVSLPGGMEKGENTYVIDNPTIVGLGLGTGTLNQTGHPINSLEVVTNGDFQLVSLFEIDSQSDPEIDLAEVDCGPATTCTLDLSQPVPAGGIVAFDAAVDGLSPGLSSQLVVTPSLDFEVAIPALSTWGLIGAAVLLLFAGLRHLARRRL